VKLHQRDGNEEDPMSDVPRLSFGVKTTPMRVTFADVAQVWRDADAIDEIDHAWLWDHFLPLFSPPTDPVLEGWTTLAALAAQTSRLGVGLLVTNNGARPPAVLGKMAATLDVISGGRLTLGIGVGGTRQPDAVDNPAVAEFGAYGLPLPAPGEGIGRLDEALRLIRRMWTADEPFDVDGRWYRTQGTVCVPRPVQPGGPPILVGGWGERTLRVVAEHADIWNVPGPPHNPLDVVVERSRVLDRHCAAIGREPASLVRSTQVIVRHDDPAATQATRTTLEALVTAGFTHLVLAPLPPYSPHIAHWLTDELILPTKDRVGER
jgi:alkanesulfonate monooxygenase SsuD/methylene tetrahydromethanopterin reductase-like flavin-dependent oxidoreductase (luciferase family)